MRGLVSLSLVTSITLVTMVLVLVWGRDRNNRAAELYDGGRLAASVTKELMLQGRILENSVDDMLEERPPSDNARLIFQGIYLIDLGDPVTVINLPPFSPAAGFEPMRAPLSEFLGKVRDALPGGLRGGLDENSLDAESSQSAKTLGRRNGFVISDQSGYAISVVPLSPAGLRRLPVRDAEKRTLVVVAIRPVLDSFLNRIATGSGVKPLTLSRAPSDDPSVSTLPIGGDGEQAFLEWRADRPGDRNLGNVGGIIVSFAALFAGLLAWRTTTLLAQAELSAMNLAGQDALSGISNRLLFTRVLDNALGQAKREGRAFALLYIDLDRFKVINDDFGHDAGDKVIVSVAQRLQSRLRSADIVARVGGDEFAILQSGVQSPSDCQVLSERLLSALREPFDLDGEQIFIGASIGISLSPRDSTDREELMRCADLALYSAKKAGRNRYSFFQRDLALHADKLQSLEEDLRYAIDQGTISVFYQPLVSIDGRRLLGVEALVRWFHPTRGMIPPLEFIGIAEKRGMIIPLGEMILRQACRDARLWPDIPVAVNVSAGQFRHPNFVESVKRILEETGLDPARLELELTESVVIDDADSAENAMFELRSMGIRLALDDFGTGYSSLIYLRRFAFDKIKIDKSFLESMEATGESAIIVHSVVHLGRSLGLTVVAEGVETSEQHRFLQALGAHQLQGYMFSKAVPAEDIMRICANGFIMPPAKPIDSSDAAEPDQKIAGAA